jgi:hypothetical protein
MRIELRLSMGQDDTTKTCRVHSTIHPGEVLIIAFALAIVPYYRARNLTLALENASLLLRPNAFRARLLAEDILLGAMREWLGNLGLGSYNQIQSRSLKTQPQFGQFRWDMMAPSYIHPQPHTILRPVD